MKPIRAVREHPLTAGVCWYAGWCIGSTLLHLDQPAEAFVAGLSTGWAGALVAVGVNWWRQPPRQPPGG